MPMPVPTADGRAEPLKKEIRALEKIGIKKMLYCIWMLGML